MVSTITVSLADLRAARENVLHEQQARTAKYEKEKAAVEAAFEADMQALAARLADLEAAERVFPTFSREQQPTGPPNGHDRDADQEAEADEADMGEEGGTEGDKTEEVEIAAETGKPETHREMVLAAVRTLRATKRSSQRFHIDQFIRREFGAEVPLTSISTYLQRLRAEGMVENPGGGLDWYSAGGPTR